MTGTRTPCGSGVEKAVFSLGRRGSPRPALTDTAFVSLSCWNASTGEEVEVKSDAEVVQILLSSPLLHRAGLALALRTMRPGERAFVFVPSALAYGAEGHFSFPAVAPGADLLFDAHLLLVAPNARPRSELLWEERMAAAGGHREQGNACLASGDPEVAAAHYAAGLSFVDEPLLAQLVGRHEEATAAERGALLNNAAAAALALRAFAAAVAHAKAAAALLPSNAKALYRLGRAHAGLGQDGAARDALSRALKLAPRDAAIQRAMKELDDEAGAQRAAAKKVFGGLFGDTPQPKTLSNPRAVPLCEDNATSATLPAPSNAGIVSRFLLWSRSLLS